MRDEVVKSPSVAVGDDGDDAHLSPRKSPSAARRDVESPFIKRDKVSVLCVLYCVCVCVCCVLCVVLCCVLCVVCCVCV